MAKKSAKGSWFKKAKTYKDKHKGEKLFKDGGTPLPPGISNGVAKITKMYIKEHDGSSKYAGEEFFYASAVVLSPEEFAEQKIEGRAANLNSISLCDTEYSSAEENYARMWGELQRLGIDLDNIDTREDLDDVFEELVGTNTLFSTVKGRNNPDRVNVYWNGPVADEDYEEVDDDDEVDDEEDSVEEDEEEVDDEDNEEEEAEEDEEEEIVPEKGDVYNYKPPRKRKPVECEVTLVNAKKRTVTLEETDNPEKVYKGVSWDKLEA